MENIRLNVPAIGDEELAEVKKVLDSGYLTQGPKVAEFENIIKEMTGAKHAFATSSATTALHLSLVSLGIGVGDEVLVADFTFPATANVVVQQDAKPVFVDILLDTFAMDPIDLEKKITSKTKAIMPIDPFGLCCNMERINEIALKYDLPVIQDSACSLGSAFDGVPVGTLGTTTCFSFHPRKSITTGEGGMVTTQDDDIANKIALLRTHGGIRKEFYLSFEEAGFNYRLSDVLAAIGVAQTKKLDYLISERTKLASKLTSQLNDIEGVTCPSGTYQQLHTYQSYVVLLPENLDRDNVIRELRTYGIESTLGTYALHAQPYFQRTYRYVDKDCKNSYRAYKSSLTLPLWAGMDDSHIDRISDALKSVIEKSK